jgi:DNA-binding transcriptional ArsR family regulator
VRTVGDVSRALATPRGVGSLDELADRIGQTLFAICSRLATKHGLGVTPGISQHLTVLEDAGLIESRKRAVSSSTS